MIFKIFLLAGVFGLIVTLCALASMLVLDLYERITRHPVKDRSLLRETSFAKQKVRNYEIVGECQIEVTNTPGVLYRNTSTGVTWVKPKDEFFDGRFEKVKLTLSAIRDLIKPGFSEERLWVDFIEEKLMMGDNFILIDDKKCLSYDDQQDMLKQNIEKWRNK